MSQTSYDMIEELAIKAAPKLALHVMNPTEIVHLLTTLYRCWNEMRTESDETVQIVNEAMVPLMELRSIGDACRTIAQFDDELERHGFERYEPPTEGM